MKEIIKIKKPKIRKVTVKPGTVFNPDKGGRYKREKKPKETDL